MKHLFLRTLWLAFVLAVTCHAQAANRDWVGTTSSDWGTAANWNPAVIPGSGDGATFNTAGPFGVALGAPQSLDSMTFGGGLSAPLNIGPFGGFGLQWSLVNRISQDSSQPVVIHPSVFCAPTCTLDGTGSGQVSFWGQFLGVPDLVVNGPAINGPAFYLGSSITAGGLTLNTVTVNGGTLKIGNSNSVTVLGPVVINSGGTLNLCNPGSFLANFSAPSMTINGTLYGNGGLTATTAAGVSVGTGGTSTSFNPGCSPATLTVNGNLIFGNNAVLNYELATPGVVGSGVNDLTIVNGSLTLDGVLNVTALPGFGVGVYRLFNYSGILTDNGLSLGSLPSGYNYAISTATPDQVNLIVSTPSTPVITQNPQSQTVLQGQTATLSFAATGATPMTFLWRRDGSVAFGGVNTNCCAVGSSLVISNAQFVDAGPYDVVVSNTFGSVTSAVAVLTVDPDTFPPTLVSAMAQCASNKVTVIFNEPVDALSAQEAFNYLISDGVNVQSASILPDGRSVCLLTDPLSSGVPYTLTVENVTDLAGNPIAPGSQSPFACSSPPVIVAQPQSLTVTQGQTATFSVIATGTPALSYQWRYINISLPAGIIDATNASFTINQAQETNSGLYDVVVANSFGSVTSTVAVLTVVTSSPCLKAWWPMAGTVTDIVGANQPSATAGISFVPGKIGQGALVGTGGYIEIPDVPALQNPNFTFEAWVRPDGIGPNDDTVGSVILEHTRDGGFAYSMYWRKDGKFTFLTGPTVNGFIVSTHNFPTGCFYHVVGTYDGADFRLYVNGALEAQRASSAPLDYSGGYPWTIGATPALFRNAGVARTWNGVIDEVKIWCRALAAAEVQAAYAAGGPDTNCACPPPMITCATNFTVECGTPWNFSPPTALDLCCGSNAAVTVLGTSTNGTCPKSIERVWLATDCRGQTSTCTQTVTVVDSTAPVFVCGSSGNLVLNGSFESGMPPFNPANQLRQLSIGAVDVAGWTIVEAGAAFYWANGAHAASLGTAYGPASDGSLYLYFNGSYSNSSPRGKVTTSVTFPSAGTYRLEYDMWSEPSINGSRDAGFTAELAGLASYTDRFTPPFSLNGSSPAVTAANWQHVTHDFWVATPGTYVLSFTDASVYGDPSLPNAGNTPSPFLDNLSLTAICCGTTRIVECGTPWNFIRPDVFDACCGTNVTLTSSVFSSGNACSNVNTIVWTAADCCTNSATCTQTVIVVDTTAPVLHCPERIKVTTCSNSMPVYFRAFATDNCDPSLPVVCTPPSGSVFNLGTTTVSCTATDDCGNVATCSFPVTIASGANFWQSFPAGLRDCYAYEFESAYPGPCLKAAYPGVIWKYFDDSTVNRFFGHTWNLPPGIYTDGYLLTQMKDNNCKGGAQDDMIYLGLQNCTTPAWTWSRALNLLGADLSLATSTSPWCNIANWGPLVRLHLTDLPPLGNNHSVLGNINATHRLDMLVQDDTRVDFARLRLRRCPPTHIIGGLGVTLTNAQLAYGSNTWTLSKNTPSASGFSATLHLGEANAVKLNFEDLILAGSVSNGNRRSVIFHGGNPDECPTCPLFRMDWGSNEFARVLLGQPLSGVSNVVVLTLSNGVVVASNTIPATAGAELASFSSTTAVQSITLDNRNGFSISAGEKEKIMSIRCKVIPARLIAFDNVSLAAEGFDEITLGKPEIYLADLEGGDLEPWEWFASVNGDALAQVDRGQLTLSALDADSTNTMGFQVRLGGATNECRATIQTSFGLLPTPSNASLTLTLPGEPVEPPYVFGRPTDLSALHFCTEQGFLWSLTATRSNAPLPFARAEVCNNGTNVITVTNPVSVQVSELPTIYWPSTSWFRDADICHRFPYSTPVTVWINGTAFTGSELRVLTATDTRLFSNLAVNTFGAEALTLVSLATGPAHERLLAPVLDGNDIVIRGNTPGAVIQSAPAITGPWSVAPQVDGEVRVSTTNTPARFFRARENP